MPSLLNNRRNTDRHRLDRFVPAVLAMSSAHTQFGGHLVDLSTQGTRIVAPPTLARLPRLGDEAALVLARSDGNRELDIDGVRQSVLVMELKEIKGSYVIRLGFQDEIHPRLERLLQRAGRQADESEASEAPEFDPDVWAGWAAIAPKHSSG